MDGSEPVKQRQLAAMHYRIRCQCCLMLAVLTTPTFVMAVPHILLAATFAANHAFALAYFSKVLLARFLSLEAFPKIYKLHECRIIV